MTSFQHSRQTFYIVCDNQKTEKFKPLRVKLMLLDDKQQFLLHYFAN